MPASAKAGDTVAVHYTGKLADGSVFDSSRSREPIEFVLGERNVLPGFEAAVLGMSTGDTKSTKIEAADAFGERQPALIVEFSRDQIPPNTEVKVGSELQVQTTSGQSIPARVVDTSAETVTLDANHPLAGKDLTFDIELVEVVAEA